MGEYRLDLFPRASRNCGLKSLNGCVVPWPRPPPCHERRLIGYGEKSLEVAAQLLHRSLGQAADSHCQIQAARSPRTRSTGAVAEHVGLVPEPATDGAGTYLWVGRPGGDGPVFAMPAEVPQIALGLHPLAERSRARLAMRHVLDEDDPD